VCGCAFRELDSRLQVTHKWFICGRYYLTEDEEMWVCKLNHSSK